MRRPIKIGDLIELMSCAVGLPSVNVADTPWRDIPYRTKGVVLEFGCMQHNSCRKVARILLEDGGVWWVSRDAYRKVQ